MPCLRFLTDNSLVEEARESQWLRLDGPRPFAEPGIEPHFGPSRAFVLHRIDLELRLDPAVNAVRGLARIHVGPTPSGIGEVVLDLADVDVHEVEGGSSWTHADGKLRIRGLTEATTLVVWWSGTPRQGLYFVNGEQIWSQCQDEDAHFFVPCFDHPSVKHAWGVTVIAPEQFQVVSNGAFISRETVDGLSTWVYDQADPMPAYLLTVVVADLEVHEDTHGDLPLRYLVPYGWSKADIDRIFGRTPEMFRALEAFYGVPYPWPRYDQVVVEDFIFGGMENVAATTLTSVCMTDERAAMDWNAEDLIAHELAHQWFGDLLTCQDWSQGWLNEGWATYTEVIWAAADVGEGRAAWTAWDMARSYFAEADGRYSRPVVSYDFREPIDVFDRHLYEKGAVILHTLRYELGEQAFRTGTTLYLDRHRHQTVHTRHFQRAMEDASGQNLDAFFQQWVFRAGYPALEASLGWKDGQLTVDVKQTQKGPYRLILRVEVDGRSVDLRVRDAQHNFVVPCDEPSSVRVDPGFRVCAKLAIKAPRGWHERNLDDVCPVVRIRAIQSLSAEASPAAVNALVRALQDADWTVAQEAAKELGKRRGDVARDALLAYLERSEHDRARVAVVRALAAFRGDEAVESRLLAMAVEGDVGLFSEGEAGLSLGRMRSAHARQACDALLGRESWGSTLRARALAGLGGTRDPAVLPTVLSFSEDSHPARVRAAAAVALGQLADEVPDVRLAAVDRLCELARCGSFRVELNAMSALARARDPRALGVLSDIHRCAPDGRTRRTAYEAIAQIRTGRGSEEHLAGLRGSVEKLEEQNQLLKARIEKLETP